MEQFAGSGPWGGNQWNRKSDDAAKALLALDLLVWNDADGFTETETGRNCATALALNHGCDWDDEKLVLVFECYAEWAEDGTLAASAYKMDTRQWREVMTFGQNAELSVANLRWIHNFANVPEAKYKDICGMCHYRLFNCFGASVHGPMYYKPWEHRWNTNELRYRVGGVCGALSKFGSHNAESHGVRAFTAGQPVHCAYVVWSTKRNLWELGNPVTGHTKTHFSLGAHGFPATEEQERYYSNPKRMGAEYLRWMGQYEAAMRYVPGNWQAAKEWEKELKARNAPKADWDKYAAVVRETFSEAPCQGWDLYFPYLETLKGEEKLNAARHGLFALHESASETVEPMYYDEYVLDPLVLSLGIAKKVREKDQETVVLTDEESAWKLLPAILAGQAKTPSFFRQAVNWGAAKLMTSPASATRFMEIVGKAAAKTGATLDFNGMVRKAAEKQDIAMWRQVYSIMDKVAPKSRTKPSGKKWPMTDYGGALLSPDGLLTTSTPSGYEDAINYRDALDPEGRIPTKGGAAFHTANETSPWGMVVLPGMSEVTGVTVVNAGNGGYNAGRQVPLKIWVSEDGEKFTEVGSFSNQQDEWKLTLSSPKKAKYIKVGRAPEQRSEVFHLSKILVYGKKLY